MYDKVAISIYPHWPEKKRTYVTNMPIHLLNIFDEIVTMKQPIQIVLGFTMNFPSRKHFA